MYSQSYFSLIQPTGSHDQANPHNILLMLKHLLHLDSPSDVHLPQQLRVRQSPRPVFDKADTASLPL